MVARPVRAWIETHQCFLTYFPFSVARPVRAWIETSALIQSVCVAGSHAPCVRGLKPIFLHNLPNSFGRTPRACVD